MREDVEDVSRRRIDDGESVDLVVDEGGDGLEEVAVGTDGHEGLQRSAELL